MKRLSVLTAFALCLFLTGAAFAQSKTTATNFAGVWELDAAKSKLPERMRVESGTLVVTQTDKQLTVATDFKRAARTENMPPPTTADGNGGAPRPEGNRGMRGEGGGGGGRGMMGGGNGTVSYNLDGKETKIEMETRGDMPPATLALKAETGKNGELKLTSSRSFETQMGAMTLKTVETWELINDGAILKIARETETPRGAQTAEMYFTRKAANASSVGVAMSNDAPVSGTSESYYRAPETVSTNNNATGAQDSSVRTISAGVLNGKALKMPLPAYPPAARAVAASGAVNVEVTLDEQGKVVAANAVSGHPLLRAAAEKAARAAEFAPTVLSGAAVKVKGIIVYNFVP